MFGETRFENLISSFGKYKVNIKVIPHFVQVNKKALAKLFLTLRKLLYFFKHFTISQRSIDF